MIKRLFDLAISISLLVLCLPVLGGIALVLWVAQGRPILFIQRRPGLRGQIFRMYKFRTMSGDPADNAEVEMLRVTKVGKMLRITSLDELPQLVNVIKGEMSLVGPRPLLPEYLPLYSERQKRRHDVRPGITGWAQVQGRNNLSWTEKFEFDIWYVENSTIGIDLKIVYLTLKKVFSREGISSKEHSMSEPFDGN